jgi:phage-related protein
MWSINFFNARVQQDIESWPVGIYADFLRLARLMEEHGADLRMPFSRAMGQGLLELRCKGQEGIGREIVILHSFIKKTQETPDSEMRIARKRLKGIKNA